jgi:glycine/D-amino acid oxidase-like deaminating enzyme
LTQPPWVLSRARPIASRLSANRCHRNSAPTRSSRDKPASAPLTQDGLPLIGKVPSVEGAYVATGHNVWGILNAPATGEALAELIVDGVARSTDLTPFDPIRLRPLDPALLQRS